MIEKIGETLIKIGKKIEEEARIRKGIKSGMLALGTSTKPHRIKTKDKVNLIEEELEDMKWAIKNLARGDQSKMFLNAPYFNPEKLREKFGMIRFGWR